MPNPIFIVLAALMVIAAVALIVVPLVRRGDPSPIAAGAIVALLPLSAVLLYVVYSNWQWGPAETTTASQNDQAPSVSEMIGRLEQRLQSNPDDSEGWQMLGRSYVVLSRYPEAVEAYGTARELTNDADVHSITGYAEALGMMRGGVMDAEVSALLDKALLLAPDDRKALWYGGLAAFELGQPGLAGSRWERLLALNPPEQMAEILREQIAAANVALGEAPPPSAPALSPQAAVPTAAASGLAVRISIAPELANRAGPDAPLFILARQSGAGGPPLAVVRRRVADLPLELVLSDADAMVPGRVLSAHSDVEVVARIALGGTPTAQNGDLSGSQRVASNGSASIIIDSVVGN